MSESTRSNHVDFRENIYSMCLRSVIVLVGDERCHTSEMMSLQYINVCITNITFALYMLNNYVSLHGLELGFCCSKNVRGINMFSSTSLMLQISNLHTTANNWKLPTIPETNLMCADELSDDVSSQMWLSFCFNQYLHCW